MNMTKNGLEGFLRKNLMKVSRSDLSILERAGLFIVGCIDSTHALPSEDDSGIWGSSTINKELSACTEAHNKIYGMLRIDLEEKYKTAAFLVKTLEHNKHRITDLMNKMPEPLAEDMLDNRRLGEEALDIMIVRERRKKEQDAKINKVKNEIEGIKRESESDLVKLMELQSYIAQKNYETELVCEKVRAHTKQRIDYYWNIAYRYAYKLKRVIPPVYTGIEIPDVVENYKINYQLDDCRIVEIINLYNKAEEVA